MSKNTFIGFAVSLSLHAALLGAIYFYQQQQSQMTIALGDQSDQYELALNMFKAQPQAPAQAQTQKPPPKPVQAKPKPVKKVEKPIPKKEPEPVIKEEPVPEEVVEEITEEVDPDVDQADQTVQEQVAVQADPNLPPLINEPVYYSQKAPSYPRKALKRGQQGTVLLMLMVDEKGRVIGVEVVETSGVSVLDKAAIKAVKRWRMEPAKREGIAIVSRVKVPVKFNLKSG